MLVAAVVLVGGLVAGASPAAAAEPIEGSWFYDGGEILIERTGDGVARGTIVRPTRLAQCTHPAGEQIWALSGTGTTYVGTHQWFRTLGCTPNPGGQATWVVGGAEGTQQTLRLCTRSPDVGGPPALGPTGLPLDAHTRCHELRRARPALPAPTFGGVIVTPPRRTTSGCRTRRFVRVRVHSPEQDPLASVVVRVARGRTRTIEGSALRRALVVRGLSKRRVRVSFVATTASGRVLKGQRVYRACPKPRRATKG